MARSGRRMAEWFADCGVTGLRPGRGMSRTGVTLAVALAVLARSLGAAANPAAAQVAAGHFEDDDGGFYEAAQP